MVLKLFDFVSSSAFFLFLRQENVKKKEKHITWNYYDTAFLLFKRSWSYYLSQGLANYDLWPITCFCMVSELRIGFTYKKCFVAHENYMKSNFNVMGELECSHLFIYILPIAVFVMQWQRWIVVRDRMACKA